MKGKKGLVVGVANAHSIAWGCAQALHDAGAELALTYLNDKAKPYVAPLAAAVDAPVFMPLDVTDAAQSAALFAEIDKRWGRLDFLLHSIAFAPKDDLHGRVTDSSGAGFATAMDISCHSLVRLTKAAEPLMAEGGTVLTMSYYGSEKVVPRYGIMGPVKAALEATVRYLAMELGPQGIRVNALSPGPVKTRAASGLAAFDELMESVAREAPLHELVTIDQIGETAAFLASDKARHITGQVIYIDNGYNIRG
ncbi:MAG: enoyl-ACP reductase FabI [Alphaproteobacteria bacterium]|nr:enoyl-ACP reductase FabI [Alphaproteobacteria bacterium]